MANGQRERVHVSKTGCNKISDARLGMSARPMQSIRVCVKPTVHGLLVLLIIPLILVDVVLERLRRVADESDLILGTDEVPDGTSV